MKKDSLEKQAALLLRNNGRLRASELVKLIREISPTALELPPDVEHRRYVIKSRLQNQSLLIRKFRGEVAITRSPTEPKVIGLRFCPDNELACHAVVADLEDDARSFVQLQIDLGHTEEENAPSPTGLNEPSRRRPKRRADPVPAPSSDNPQQLLELGREALRTYNYEHARTSFEKAFSMSGGGTTEAIALLDFLVDHVAAYADALELSSRLSQPALHCTPATFAVYSRWPRHTSEISTRVRVS
jgi:hypothetical protein